MGSKKNEEFPLGVVLLDLAETELPRIVSQVVDQMVTYDEVPSNQKNNVVQILLESQGQDAKKQNGNVVGNMHYSKASSMEGQVNLGFEVEGNEIDSSTLSKVIHHVNHNARKISHTNIEVEGDAWEKNFSSDSSSAKGVEATAVMIGSADFMEQPTVAFVRLADGVAMENVTKTNTPVRFVFVLLGPFKDASDYQTLGNLISTLMSDKGFHDVAYNAHTKSQLLNAINNYSPPTSPTEAACKHVMVRQSNKEPSARNPLQREGKLFYGLIQDVKIRYSQYWSDIKDGINVQVFSTAIFIFFAALSPAVTFGGVYADRTDRLIGVGETLLVSSINGIIFALFAAQPLLIIGATGPLMIFDMSLLTFCQSFDLDYLSIRVWVGIWMSVIGVLVAAFEVVGFIVDKFTRFTEEIFSTLVCIIFIYEAFAKLVVIFQIHPLKSHDNIEEEEILSGTVVNGTVYNGTNIKGESFEEHEIHSNQPNTALLSMCLMIGTFLIAWKLRKLRNSKLLGRSIRRALGDFGVPISIILMVTLDYLIKDTYTDKLKMPSGLQPSNAEVRGWFINPYGVISTLPVWCMFAAAPAAFLLFILIFLEENICHLILSKPERCLKKGSGFHLDIILSCMINTIAGFLGAPFMGPACVRTISHMSALTVMSTTAAPGESHKIVGCREQRVSAFIVSLLVGLGVMLYQVLNLVPTAVLLGIFLYMGVSATAGIQLLERVVLFFMPVKHHPKVPYVTSVRTWKMHLFTGIQVLMLVILWVVKQSPAALAVPFVLLLLLPIRLHVLPFGFSAEELDALCQTANKSDDSEPDFYETAHDLPCHHCANEVTEGNDNQN